MSESPRTVQIAASNRLISREFDLFAVSLSDILYTAPKRLRYGLASSVFSGSSARAVKLGEAIRCGMTNINDFGVNYLVQVSASFPACSWCGASGVEYVPGSAGLMAACLPLSVVLVYACSALLSLAVVCAEPGSPAVWVHGLVEHSTACRTSRLSFFSCWCDD